MLVQLINLRNEKIDDLLVSKDVEKLSIFEEEPAPKRIKIEKKVDMPASVAIDAPTIGDTVGIEINMVMS